PCGGRAATSRRTQRDPVGLGLHRDAVRRGGLGPLRVPERRRRRNDRPPLSRRLVHVARDGGPIGTRRGGLPSVARGRRSWTLTVARSPRESIRRNGLSSGAR